MEEEVSTTAKNVSLLGMFTACLLLASPGCSREAYAGVHMHNAGTKNAYKPTLEIGKGTLDAGAQQYLPPGADTGAVGGWDRVETVTLDWIVDGYRCAVNFDVEEALGNVDVQQTRHLYFVMADREAWAYYSHEVIVESAERDAHRVMLTKVGNEDCGPIAGRPTTPTVKNRNDRE
jgi:hypothetical protein